LPLVGRRRRLERLLRTEVPCQHLVETFDDGQLLAVAERHRLEGVVSKRR
jgi:ATP-dependent DNA ligase